MACSARAVEGPEERGHSWNIVHCIISIPFPEALASLSQVVLTNLLLFLWTNKEKHVIILYAKAQIL